MKLRVKFYVGYVFLVLVLSGGILLCLKPLAPIERRFDVLSAENLPVLNLAQNIRILGSLLYTEIRDASYLLSFGQTPEIRAAIDLELLEVRGLRSQFLEEFKEYHRMVENYFPGEDTYLPLLQAQVEQLSNLSDELESIAAGYPEPYTQAKRGQIKKHEKQFLSVIDQIIREEIHETRVRRERVNDAVDDARSWIQVTFIVSLVFAASLALLFSRSLSRSDDKQESESSSSA